MATDDSAMDPKLEMETNENDNQNHKIEPSSETEKSNTDGNSKVEEKSESEDTRTGSSSEISENNIQSTSDTKPKEMVDIKVIYNKQKYDVSFDMDETVSNLKTHIQTLTSVPVAMQKVMYKGLVKDDQTLRDLKVTKGAKFMVVGSKLQDVMAVNAPDPKEIQKEEAVATAQKEALCNQKMHKKVLEKYGKPDDVAPGIKGVKEPLPTVPVSGMYNKAGGKVRLTFKLELDQLWIGTKERTDKIPMNSIKAVVSEPIEGHEAYHLMGIQLGPTEASRYWIYWVPAQYVDAIKDTVLGKWQFF
ncbi:ubiquitin domain-containing protein UBFD1 [Lingula anatina]|uniref:Ubiquitin domain-containing protein UBFD1 n=1 Tax=Lingula anatina TaxID=7574 RepID=A0A1S3I6L9_LINAN|nr:ubiquitin domain-containing protein UBFD1 [Lingula anatina]|eukprot:XP_013393902.1 ubiquitin domain-containing protein UBFD1 [Lingula anatina]